MDRKRSKKVTNEKDIKKHKFSKKKKNCDSSGEDSVDMSEVLYPLTHYLKDREEMIKQVFSVMEKEKLNCMLPPILKEMSKSSLMDTCLKELKNMSDDEVRQVLRGDPYKPSDVKPVPVQQSVDSDSAESNEQNEKKTLLDILEQEMQEIAYNTILRRDENLTVSVEELPDIVAISPNPSPSKEESTVPLICIDSEDEEAAFKSSGMQHHTSRTECIANSQVEIIDVEDSADGSQCPLVSVGMEDKCSHPKSEEVLSKKDVSKCKSTFDSQTKSGTERGEENFLIQIFCDKVSNSERVVTKVCDSGTSILSSRNESTADTGFDDKEYSEKNVQSSTKVSQIQVAVLETEEKRRMSHCNSVSYNKIFQAESNFHSRLDPNYLLFPQVVKPSCNLQCFDPSNKTINGESEHPSKSVEIQEKEEGEISEEDSEEVEVLEAERGKRSPTVFLSSDEDESGMSIRDCKEQKCSKRKHKRRHLESKEHLRNHIEKRGNRSYRRKKSSPATEGHNMSASTEILPEEMNTSSKESFSHSLKEVVSKESSEILKRNLSPRVQSDSTSSVIKVLNADSVVSPADDGVCSETCLLNYMHDDLGNIPLPLEVLDSVCSNSDSLAEDGVCSETVMVDNLNENLENIPCDSSRIDSADEGETVGDSKACSSKSSWADRWAQKKDLKKVVITSKIYRNVRKKIISARKKQGSQDKFLVEAPFLPPVPPLVLHVEGSVQEYEMLQCLVSDVQEEVNKEKSDLSSVSLPVISIADNVRNFTGHLDLSKNTTENQNCLDSQNGTDLQHNVSLDSS